MLAYFVNAYSYWVATSYCTSVMIIIVGASLSEQHTDLLICHCTKHASRTSRSHKPTARTATVSVASYIYMN